jgi:hypothetical protein
MKTCVTTKTVREHREPAVPMVRYRLLYAQHEAAHAVVSHFQGIQVDRIIVDEREARLMHDMYAGISRRWGTEAENARIAVAGVIPHLFFDEARAQRNVVNVDHSGVRNDIEDWRRWAYLAAGERLDKTAVLHSLTNQAWEILEAHKAEWQRLANALVKCSGRLDTVAIVEILGPLPGVSAALIADRERTKERWNFVGVPRSWANVRGGIGVRVDELIRRAFPAESPPMAENLVTDECSSCVAIRGALVRARWDAVPAELLEEQAGSMPQLTPTAFVYYLPAFLLQAIAEPWTLGIGTSKAVFHAVHSVCDPALPDDAWWRSRFSLLNDAQRTAVAAFVYWAAETLANDVDEVWLRTTAEAAFRKYWGAYYSHFSKVAE